jgi:hypothetical protein
MGELLRLTDADYGLGRRGETAKAALYDVLMALLHPGASADLLLAATYSIGFQARALRAPSETEQSRAAKLLWQVCSLSDPTREVPLLVVRAGGIPPLAYLLKHSPRPASRVRAASTLALLAYDAHAADELMSAGAVPLLAAIVADESILSDHLFMHSSRVLFPLAQSRVGRGAHLCRHARHH